jgi:alpha-D-ribose 1-methylphosphonate 5-triphosphate synthase subunit PhnG
VCRSQISEDAEMLRDAMREKARLLKASMTRKLRKLTQNQTQAEEEAKSDDDDEQEGEMDVCARETKVVVVGGRMGGQGSAFTMLATLRMANESWIVRRFVHLAQQLEFCM